VAVARPVAPDEVEVAFGTAAAARQVRPATSAHPGPAPGEASGARSAGSLEGGDLVETQFDAGRIQAVVATQQRTLARCLNEHAARAPDFSGEVPLEFTVGNEGKVVRVVLTDPRLRQGPLRDCFERILSTWSFDRFPGQRPTVSLVFRVGQ
jgi:outer membrane biosynthesis protein TonB